jgi:hypothetical protein
MSVMNVPDATLKVLRERTVPAALTSAKVEVAPLPPNPL